VRCLIPIGLGVILAACGSSEAPKPVTKTTAEIRPEVAAAPGRLYLIDGRVLPADQWHENGDVLFYEWNGEHQMLLRTKVERIEGTPKPRNTVVGSIQTVTTLPAAPPPPPVVPLHTLRGHLDLYVNADNPKYVAKNVFFGDSLRPGVQCIGDSGYRDISSQTQVIVTDQSGRVIATGSLEPGVIVGGPIPYGLCRFKFEIGGLAEVEFYGVEVGRRGRVMKSLTEMTQSNWTVAVTLGL
jgi:hypothetical protein